MHCVGKSLSGRPIQTLGVSRHYELMYNMGIQLLHCGQPKAAFDCLVQTTNVYHLNPRLWLRLAECCIMAYKSVSMQNHVTEKKKQKKNYQTNLVLRYKIAHKRVLGNHRILLNGHSVV